MTKNKTISSKKAKKPTVKAKKTDKNIELILSLISIAKPIAEACKAAGVNPDSFYTWLNKDEKLAEKYARAKELACQRMADEIIQIADEANPLDVNKDRLRIDSRKWLLSKLMAKKYGDKLNLEGDGAAPTIINVVRCKDE